MGFMRMAIKENRVRILPQGLAGSVPCSALVLALVTPPTLAMDVGVVGLFPGKAVIAVNGGAPRTISVGARTPEGIRLIAVDGDAAIVEVDGRRQRLGIGERAFAAPQDDNRPATVTLMADGKGHFVTPGAVNGSSVSFMVDTGATLVSLGRGDATRAGVDYRQGEPGMAMTANGMTRIWRVRLDTVKVGEIVLREVDASVHEHDLPVVLLGMSFLNRMEMKRDGETMTLRRRF
jgi:aspartyl protease family protein